MSHKLLLSHNYLELLFGKRLKNSTLPRITLSAHQCDNSFFGSWLFNGVFFCLASSHRHTLFYLPSYINGLVVQYILAQSVNIILNTPTPVHHTLPDTWIGSSALFERICFESDFYCVFWRYVLEKLFYQHFTIQICF